MGNDYTKATAGTIREKLNTGGYAEKWHAKGAVTRSSVIEAEKQRLLAEIEAYFRARSNGKVRGVRARKSNGGPTTVSANHARQKQAPNYETLTRELEALEARKCEILKLIEAAELQELIIKTHPARIRQALALLEECEREERAREMKLESPPPAISHFESQ